MSYYTFENTIGVLRNFSASAKKFAAHVKYGVQTRVDFSLERVGSMGVLEDTRKAATFTNSMTALGVVKPELVDDYDVLDGINAAMMNGDGTVNAEAFAQIVSQSGVAQRNPQSVAIYIMDGFRDNAVTMLYNLLRLYVIAGNKQLEYIAGQDFYNDGHVQLLNSSLFGPVDGCLADLDIVPPLTNCTNVNAYYGKDIAAIPEVPYIASGNMSGRSLGILALACGSFTPRHSNPFLVAHQMPSLAQEICFVSSGQAREAEYVTLDEITAQEVLAAIMAFVETSRLEVQFDMAYAMFIGCLYMPKARSAEALPWNARKLTGHFPKLKMTRGLVVGALNGVGHVVSERANATYGNWKKSPTRAFVHALGVTEVAAVEAYRLMASPEFQTSWPTQVAGVDLLSAGAAADLALLGMSAQRFNLETKVYLPYNSPVGIKRWEGLVNRQRTMACVFRVLDKSAYEHYQLDVVANSESAVPLGRLTFRKLVPVVYPIANLGNDNQDLFMATKVVEANLRWDSLREEYYTTSPMQANKMMAVLRVAGWNASFTYAGMQRVSNWAANADGHYINELGTFSDGELRFAFDASALKMRKHCFFEDLDLRGDEVKIKMTTEIVKPVLFIDNVIQPDLGPKVTLVERRTMKEVASRDGNTAATVYAEVMITSKGVTDFTGFRLLATTAAAEDVVALL